MKVSEVPQERGIMPGDIHEICYAVDESGRYVLTESAGWEPKNITNGQAWKLVQAEAAEALESVHAGRRSPLAFHMAVNQMTVGLLSKYVRLNRWRVRRHLKPKVFKRLPAAVLERYAEVLEISLDQLLTVPAKGSPCLKETAA